MKSSKYRHTLPAFALVAVLGGACGPREEATQPDGDTNAAAVVEPDPDAAAAPEPLRARAELDGVESSGVSGSVEVTEEPGGVRVVVHVSGVEQMGPHGIHIHDGGSCDPPDFQSAGSHFNPTGAPHACPPDTPRHVGDLGNVDVGEDGDGHLELRTDLLTVGPGSSSVLARAVVLHTEADDCTTQPSGDSGDRLACGVFEIE